jgi:glycosyltransferase involved in cell wall biosynthesis
VNGASDHGRLHFACVGTYPPRKCGIATFTDDLCRALCRELDDDHACRIVALDDLPQGYAYPDRVRFQVRQDQPADYRLAAEFMNLQGMDLVLVQHEYGIFGGSFGSHLLALLRDLRVPIVTSMHTVLRNPPDGMRQVTQELIRLSDRVVVMAERAVEYLRQVYNVPEHKIALIPHGIPDLPFVDPSFHKDQFGVAGRKVMLTFGLLSPGKGIEYAIEALPCLVRKHPDLIYIVLGATHPHVTKTSGEQYRQELAARAEALGVRDHVVFEDRYVDLAELCDYLGAADIYVTPYLGQEQIVSGTLAYALGAGKAVVSTPYSYAQEMLADGRGRLVPFRDPEAIAREVDSLLSDPTEQQAMRKRAYLFTRDAVWRQVARRYLALLDEARRAPDTNRSRLHERPEAARLRLLALPDLRLDHLRTLTDGVGVLQHARFAVPDRDHGYCTDDNARALLLALRAYHATHNPDLLPLAGTYLGFLTHAFNPERNRFRNLMSYDRRWREEAGSEDAHARSLWALGYAVALAPRWAMRAAALHLFERALPAVVDFTSPRAWAFALVGMHAYLRRYPGDAGVRRIRETLALRLYEQYRNNVDDDWIWPEDVVTYANGKLPHSLLLAGQAIARDDLVDMGLKSLDWLLHVQTEPSTGVLSFVGNGGWLRRGGEPARFDQQPIEAHALVEACLEAFSVTADRRWLAQARRCFDWFLGKNVLGRPLYDGETGGCHDGLHPSGVNGNQGAESTLAWLLSLLAMRNLDPPPQDGRVTQPALLTNVH